MAKILLLRCNFQSKMLKKFNGIFEMIEKIEQLNIEVAGNCNLRCKMCPQASGREESFLSKLPLDLFYKAVDEALPLGLKYVNIGGGGEPTIYRD